MTNSIPPVSVSIPGRALQAVSLLWNVPLGMISGARDGARLFSSETALPEITLKLATEQNRDSIGRVGYNFFKWIFGDVIGKGGVDLGKSGFLDKLGKIFSKEGFDAFTKILSPATSGGIGARGGLLVALAVGAGVTGLVLGLKEAFSSWGKVSDIKKGYHPDSVNSSLLQGIKALSGLTTAVGGIAMINPRVGLPILAAGLVGSFATSIVQYFIGGINWFRYPELAPYPLNNFFQMFRNRNVYEPK